MTVLEVIRRGAEYLGRFGVDSPRLQIELLLAHALGMSRLDLYLKFERVLTEAELDVLREMVRRRSQRVPLQHIVGSTSFCGLEISVTPDVLIPRPETELLAERAWKYVNSPAVSSVRAPIVLDWGTGSGCLAIAIAANSPKARIHATDISAAALAVARSNAARHQKSGQIQFHEGDGFGALRERIQFDLVVANPPYIPSPDIDHLDPEVRDHDPRLALDGGADGLDVYRRLAVETPSFLSPEGKLMIELGDGQEGAVRDLFTQNGWKTEAVERDYSKRPRFMVLNCAKCLEHA